MNDSAHSVLEQLRSEIDALRVHKDKDGRPSLKKPLLLLLVLSKLDRGELAENRIRFESVAEELAGLIRQFGGRDVRGGAGPDQPFVYLKTAPFWELHLPGDASEKTADQRKRATLDHPETYAKLPNDIHRVLSSSREARQAIAQAILGKWWSGDERDRLRSALKL